ncbi:MAG: GNAT family N-acetyltransferase [Candidatus Bathyarchaeota archaeon]|nr:MAG: GNAT family N-acetyltransferase [Candidatus Bathyarchaeota archaeon]
MSKSLLKACRRFLTRDPVANVLPLGDLYSPLFQVSDVYCAVENSKVVGVCAIYGAFSTPSVVLGTATQTVKKALIKKAVVKVSDEFISLCPPDDVDLFKEYSVVSDSHLEHQMLADSLKTPEHRAIKAQRVKRRDLEALNRFYVESVVAEAWAPIQFRAGPYYCVKHDDRVISAAGVHLVTPQIAQLGNIVTDKAYRNQGFATACTHALSSDLISKGRIISLFVRIGNAPAIHMYEKLGFHKTREISFLVLRKKK